MAQYKILFAGEDDYEADVFDTYEEAEEHALYLASCMKEGAEILYMSNPGDYDPDDYDDNFEIVEVDED